jgi:hypothetical protein
MSSIPGGLAYATPFASVLAEIANKQAQEKKGK